MTSHSSPTAAVVRNTARKNGSVRDGRRMTCLDHAVDLVGGHKALAQIIGADARGLARKIAGERPIHDAELALAARSLSTLARNADDLAARLAALIESSDQGVSA